MEGGRHGGTGETRAAVRGALALVRVAVAAAIVTGLPPPDLPGRVAGRDRRVASACLLAAGRADPPAVLRLLSPVALAGGGFVSTSFSS